MLLQCYMKTVFLLSCFPAEMERKLSISDSQYKFPQFKANICITQLTHYAINTGITQLIEDT